MLSFGYTQMRLEFFSKPFSRDRKNATNGTFWPFLTCRVRLVTNCPTRFLDSTPTKQSSYFTTHFISIVLSWRCEWTVWLLFTAYKPTCELHVVQKADSNQDKIDFYWSLLAVWHYQDWKSVVNYWIWLIEHGKSPGFHFSSDFEFRSSSFCTVQPLHVAGKA